MQIYFKRACIIETHCWRVEMYAGQKKTTRRATFRGKYNAADELNVRS